MSYDVQIVADSLAPNGVRVTTFALRYPRMIHSEFMTHRIFSRNASSTRAIPTAKLIEWVERDPAMPVYWGKNQKGMQATAELGPDEVDRAERHWLLARDEAVTRVRSLVELGVHKQIAGRILEPWAHINVVVTATNFDNFFALRCDKNAMPEIQKLAVMMARLYRDQQPEALGGGWWHLPFVLPSELARLRELRGKGYNLQDDEPSLLVAEESRCLKLSVARCARVSYKTFEGKEPDPKTDIALHDSLFANGHFSPFEHQGRAGCYSRSATSGNFRGWTQYRQTLKGSVRETFDFAKLDEFGDRDFIVT